VTGTLEPPASTDETAVEETTAGSEGVEEASEADGAVEEVEPE